MLNFSLGASCFKCGYYKDITEPVENFHIDCVGPEMSKALTEALNRYFE